VQSDPSGAGCELLPAFFVPAPKLNILIAEGRLNGRSSCLSGSKDANFLLARTLHRCRATEISLPEWLSGDAVTSMAMTGNTMADHKLAAFLIVEITEVQDEQTNAQYCERVPAIEQHEHDSCRGDF
jgi:hypothetical protein